MTSILVTIPAQVARLAALGLVVCLVSTGCSNDTNNMNDTPSEQNQQLDEQTLVDTQPEANDSSAPIEAPSTEAPKGEQGKPVTYDIANWDADGVEPFELTDLDAMKAVFGEVATTDKNSLDYASNTATKYRFMQGEDPYLDIIDSQSYVEMGWYYANPNDSEAEKEASTNHAKKAYKAAYGLMGEAGTELINSMLIGQIVKEKQVGEQQVELAKCEFYSCMLILKKAE